jgi:hypothetical protein
MSFVIKERTRIQASPPTGFDASWTEFQVWSGKKIISRHDTRGQAEGAIKTLAKAIPGRPLST